MDHWNTSSVAERFVYPSRGINVSQGPSTDTSQNTYSPLAYFSSVTLAEHDAVQSQLDAARRKVAAKQAELDEATREHQQRTEKHLAEIERSEFLLRDDLASIVAAMNTLQNSLVDHMESDKAEQHECFEERKALEVELASIAQLEDDLKRLRDSVSSTSNIIYSKRADFIRENERCAQDFTRARDETMRVGAEISRHLNDSPRRRLSANGTPLNSSIIPPRAPVVTPSRYVSPSRRSVALTPEVRRGTPPRRGQDQPLEAATLQPLHQLCSSGDLSEALALLRQRPELVNALDSDANTPLHAACASPNISLELVNALLTAGASLNAKNDEGLTPWHVACLNPADHATHSLKKLFLFKAGVNANQRTSRGETAAHLCARHDRHLEALRYLTTCGCDLHIAALSPVDLASDSAVVDRRDRIGSPQRLTPLETAQRSGLRARRCAEFIQAALQT